MRSTVTYLAEPPTRPALRISGARAISPRLAVACAALAITGCVGTSSSVRTNTDAASITYALPETRVAVGLDVVLTDCSGQWFQVEPTLSLVPQAIGGAERYTLSAADLASFSKKRDVAIQLNDNGTIQSLGAAVSDRTLIIAANTIKLATLLVGAIGLHAYETVVPGCNNATKDAVDRLKTLGSLQASLRKGLADLTDPDAISKTREAITAVAHEIADLRSGPLRLELRSTVTPPKKAVLLDDGTSPPIRIAWDKEPFLKWVDPEFAEAAATRFALGISLRAVSPLGEEQTKAEAMAEDEIQPTCGKALCPSLVIRAPALALIEVRFANTSLWKDTRGSPIEILGNGRVPVAQWGRLTYLPLTGEFAATTSVKIGLDPFGRKMSLGLTSEARGEVLTGGLISVGDAMIGLDKAMATPTQLQQQMVKIAELEALQKYNKLIKCEEILKAGGHEC